MAEQKKSPAGTLPKNIRQIGINKGNTRVYLEDYVYTYLHSQEEQEAWTHRGFVLIGRIESGRDYTRYFISGLIRLEDKFFKEGILEFGDETWAHIYKEMKKYYDDLEITGWGQDISGASASLTAELERNHKQNFNIQKNVLFLLDQVEKEEAFYVFEKNILQRKEGYYVYYEKNPQMQEYMIESNQSQQLDISPEEIAEPLVHSYRETLLEKKAQMSARKWNGVLYTTSTLLVLSVCVLGVSTVNNVEKMQNLESAVSQISGSGQASGVPVMSQNTQPEDGTGSAEKDSEEQKAGSKKNTDEKTDSSVKGTDEETDHSQNADEKTDGQDTVSDADSSQSTDGQKNSGQKTGNKDSDTDDGSNAESGGKDSEQVSTDSLETASLSEAQTYLLQGYYIVKKGDSLVGISKRIYGTAAKAGKICELNGIDDMDKIYAGQRLELP